MKRFKEASRTVFGDVLEMLTMLVAVLVVCAVGAAVALKFFEVGYWPLGVAMAALTVFLMVVLVEMEVSK